MGLIRFEGTVLPGDWRGAWRSLGPVAMLTLVSARREWFHLVPRRLMDAELAAIGKTIEART